MNKKPYLISLASHTDGCDRYLKSLHRLEDSVSLVYVEFAPHAWKFPVSACGLSDVRHIRHASPYPGPHPRWQYIPEDLDPNRWWVFADTADVLFQRPIPDLDQFDADILVQCEGMTHAENPVWGPYIRDRYPQYSSLLPLPVLCCGVVACKGWQMLSFVNFIKGFDPNVWDQIPFNLWVRQFRYMDCRELSMALYGNAYDERGSVIRTADGSFLWGSPAIIPAIVHGNGAAKELLGPEPPE